jgi:hypothetical protein
VTIALGIWLVAATLPRWLTSTEGTAPNVQPDRPEASATRQIKATLFYVAEHGTELIPQSRDVPYGATPADQARRIVEAQVGAPPTGARSAIPAGTTVRAVFLTGSGEAYVDLGGAIRSGHTGGSLGEALAVYAIVNALTVNLRDVTAVQILIEGREVDTLAGHLDLRYPLRQALDWVQKE